VTNHPSFEEFVAAIVKEQNETVLVANIIHFTLNFLDHISTCTGVHPCVLHGSVAGTLLRKIANEGQTHCVQSIINAVEEVMEDHSKKTKH